ncbi:MAG: insulinase family protein [Clostridia bacterium]|nr:insulinase family protein [Clostridia bacterium]
MEIGSVIKGFQVKRVRDLAEMDATLWEMEHVKSGARLCWIDRKEENKAFSIAFKTLPEDSTGVFHILEHSVLCGSDRYPVKEPFVELLKSSVRTFLNAFTFPDKTVYPVSSRNDRDFLNLIDVYLDAVLHPLIYHKPEIFRQEGWRYEGEGEDLCYQGVVFNEMKGSFASPQTLLYNEIQRALFPDNCYRFVSGGDPERIPDLTYEQFIANHRTYYHPSNARISLVGSIDVDAVLGRIDSFMSAYDRIEADFTIPMQKPIDRVVREIPFEIGADEPAENRAIVTRATVLGSFETCERNFAASVLTDYLTGDNDAPLKRAVIDRGLAQDFSFEMDDSMQQSIICWQAMNTEADKREAIEQTVRETLETIVNEGLDRARLSACLHSFAFRMRDREGGWFGLPRSLSEAISMLNTWLYDGDPADGLLVEAPLKALEEKLGTGYFEALIRELFLENEHTATIVLVPSQTLGAEKRAKEAARVRAESAAWTEADRERVRKEAESLKAFQQTPDSEEALKTIPMLKLSDLNDEPDRLVMEQTERSGVTVLDHTVGSGTAYLCAYFAADDLELDELPLLPVMGSLLGSLATACHTRSELPLAVKNTIGKLDFSTSVLPGNGPETCRVFLYASAACLREQTVNAAELLGEILTETCWNDEALLKEILQQMLVGAKLSLPAQGHRYGMMRVAAHQTASGAADERIGGISFIQWLNGINERGDEALKELTDRLGTLAKRLFARERLTVARTEAVSDEAVDTLIAALPHGAAPETAFASYPVPAFEREGVTIPAQVGFAAVGSNLMRHGRAYSGVFPVLANVLNYVYLWNEIRVQGGAYGCGFAPKDSGNMLFYTYRDPQTKRSLGVIKKTADFLRAFCEGKPDLTGFILSAVSSVDPLRNAPGKMEAATVFWFRGMTREQITERYRTLIRTTPDDLLALCPVFEELAADDSVCVVAGKDQLDACAGVLETVLNV